MTASSLRMIVACVHGGLLTKEAAAELVATRNRLVHRTMHKVAHDLVAAMRAAVPFEDMDLQKLSGILPDFLGGARKAEKSGGGILDKIKSGRLTGRGEGEHHGWGDVAMNLTKMLGLAGLTAGATAGAGAIMRHSRDKKLHAKIQESYKQMFNDEPKLHEHDEEQPGSVARRFGILRQFAPSLAAEPAVAGAWVRASLGTGQIGPGDIKNLAETQRRIDEMHEGRNTSPAMAPLKVTEIAQKSLGG